MSSRGNSGPSVFRQSVFVCAVHSYSNSGGVLVFLLLLALFAKQDSTSSCTCKKAEHGCDWCHATVNDPVAPVAGRIGSSCCICTHTTGTGGGKKRRFSAAIQNNVLAFLFFPSDTFCTSAVNGDSRFPSKELPAAGGGSTWWLCPLCRGILRAEMSCASPACGLFLYRMSLTSSADMGASCNIHVSAQGVVAWCR